MSGDKDEATYNEYFETMPWTSNGYDKEAYNKKMAEFGIKGIPTLVVLNKDGTAATKTARADINKGVVCMKDWLDKVK